MTTTIQSHASAPSSTLLDSVGVNTTLDDRSTPCYNLFPQVLPLLQSLGVTHVRDNAIYNTLVNSNHYYYQNVRTLVAGGIKFSMVCADPLNLVNYTSPEQLENIYNWCNGGVEIFEGSNESAISRFPETCPLISADHQEDTYSFVKASSLLSAIPVASPSYIQGAVPCIWPSVGSNCDWLNIHPYPGSDFPETTNANALSAFIAASAAKMGNKPVLVSETGYQTALQTTSGWLPVSEAIKARYLPRLLLLGYRAGVKRSYIFELIDHANLGPTDPESNLGLCDFNGNPKASFGAVKNLLSLLSPTPVAPTLLTWSLTGDNTNVQYNMFSRADGSNILLLWIAQSGWDAVNRATLPPVQRNSVIGFTGYPGPNPTSFIGHSFQDDGTMISGPLPRITGGYGVTISEQLTAIEIS